MTGVVIFFVIGLSVLLTSVLRVSRTFLIGQSLANFDNLASHDQSGLTLYWYTDWV